MERKSFFPVKDIISEFKDYLSQGADFDTVTVVGEGEPTLSLDLKELIMELKKYTDKPIAVITNGTLMINESVREALFEADIVLPSLDAFDELSFREINRPHEDATFANLVKGLKEFSNNYSGQLWLEVMLVKGVNDGEADLIAIKKIIDDINCDKVYINTPVRPPAEGFVKEPTKDTVEMAIEILGGISLDNLVTGTFYSNIEDDYEAVLAIIKRHPMNQYEIREFLKSRNCSKKQEVDVFKQLEGNNELDIVHFKNCSNYRYK